MKGVGLVFSEHTKRVFFSRINKISHILIKTPKHVAFFFCKKIEEKIGQKKERNTMTSSLFFAQVFSSSNTTPTNRRRRRRRGFRQRIPPPLSFLDRKGDEFFGGRCECETTTFDDDDVCVCDDDGELLCDFGEEDGYGRDKSLLREEEDESTDADFSPSERRRRRSRAQKRIQCQRRIRSTCNRFKRTRKGNNGFVFEGVEGVREHRRRDAVVAIWNAEKRKPAQLFPKETDLESFGRAKTGTS